MSSKNAGTVPVRGIELCVGRDLQFKCTNSLLPSLEMKFGLVQYWEQTPRTVQDAVNLVRLLGLRYLWVDSICIVQDSQADMQDQFPKMGQIYGNALLTIVAADGDDASTHYSDCSALASSDIVKTAEGREEERVAKLDLDSLDRRS